MHIKNFQILTLIKNKNNMKYALPEILFICF